MANADGYVIPKPGIPKTLGILNVIFAVILLLIGLCSGGFLLALPALSGITEKAQKDVQAKVEAQKQAQIKSYEEKEKAATTDEEKAAIRQERDAAVASAPQVQVMSLDEMTPQLKDPTSRLVTFFNLGSGILLHLMLLVAGIGLIRLTAWGRSWSLSWAGIQIAQILLVSVLGAVYVTPIALAQNEKNLAKVQGNNPGAAQAAKISKAMTAPAMIIAMQAITVIASCTYPVIVLILLSRPGARAACLGPKPEGPADF